MSIGLRSAASFTALLAFGILSSPAFGHAHLKRSAPAASASLSAAPKALTLTFTEAIELKLATVTLSNGQGKAVEIPAAAGIDGDAHSLTVALPDLPAGTYKVEWAVTSVDTHRSNGDYSFTVKP